VLKKVSSEVDGQSGRTSRTSLAVLIVGMHRSGTSALGGVLNLLGVPAPEQQVTTDHHNQRGYFEPQRIVDFHEALFARLGSPSNDPLPLDYAWVNSPVGQAAAEELAALLDDEFAGEPLRLFKDPRMCRLLPVWTEALQIDGRQAVAILPARHPLEVAGSLAVKAGLSRPYSLFMWLQHVVYGERFSRGMARSFTLYDDLMTDWRSLVAKMERELDIVWPRDLMRAGPEIDAFLTGELRHHSAETPLDVRDPLQRLCQEAWDALKRLHGDANDAGAMASLDRIADGLTDAVGLFGPLVVSYQRDVERLLGAHDEVRIRDGIIADQVEAIHARDAEVTRLLESDRALAVVRARLAQRDQELRLANEGVYSRDRHIRDLDDLVKYVEDQRRTWESTASSAQKAHFDTLDRLAETLGRLAALENSTAWKLTHVPRKLAQRHPALGTLARRSAKLLWWTGTGQLIRRLGERAVPAAVPLPLPLAEPTPATAEVQTAPPIPNPIAVRDPKAGLHIAFLSGEPDTPGHKYRISRMAEAARALGSTTSITRLDQAHAELDHFRRADLIYIWRAAYDPLHMVSVMEIARAAGIPVIFDVDDLIIDPALTETDVIDGLRSQKHDPDMIRDYFARLQWTLIESDFGCTPTPALSQAIKKWSKTGFDKVVFRIPNGFDEPSMIRSRLAARARRAEDSDGLVRIGYAAGSRTHQADFAQVVPALARILREHPEARLVAFTGQWGPTLDVSEYAEFDGLHEQIEWRQFVPIDSLPDEMARFDINLAPLETGNIFCEAKSELKYFEAALVDTPTIASPTEPYRMAIRDGVTGFLALTGDDWYAALKRLMTEPGLRKQIARAARLDSLARYGPERRTDLFGSMLEQTLQRGRPGARAFALEIALGLDRPVKTPRVPDHTTLFEHDRRLPSTVTVVVPLYNYAQHVVETLESIRAQTMREIDLIVVDDRSTDDSASVAEAWLKEHCLSFNRVALLQNTVNSGLALTRNVGFANADTPFVLPLDADNRLLPDALDRLLGRLRTTTAAFAYPLTREFGDAETSTRRSPWEPSAIFTYPRDYGPDTSPFRMPLGSSPFDPSRFRSANYIDAMALVRLSAWATVGGYDHIRFGWEDYDFWCKLVEQGLFGEQVAEVLAEYRVHNTSMLRSQTDVEGNKRRLLADIHRRHPWLRVAEADHAIHPPAQAPASVGADHPRTAEEQARRLERILPYLRCPETGQPLTRRGAALGVTGSAKAWPLAHGRPVLLPGLGEPRVMAGDHVSNELPERAIKLIENTDGLVLNLSAGGSARSFDHVVEAEFAVFRHTDVLADAHALPFADATFDLVVSMNAFEHYHSPRQAADEIMRVLKPGGRMLVRTAFLQPLHEAPWHFYNCTRYGLERWFERFETEDLHVSDNFNPIHSLAWFMSDAEALLRQELSDKDAERFAEAKAGEFIALWRDPSSRDNAIWKSFFELPRAAQEGLAAGFEYLGRKPD
jgi:glycosyltransferase involved in cell wall biosynthesis/SAM-dependent methyltransferase